MIGKVNNKLVMTWNEVAVALFKVICNFLKRLRKTTKNLNQGREPLCQGLNSGYPTYKAALHSVFPLFDDECVVGWASLKAETL
jgi:hypothetical protein